MDKYDEGVLLVGFGGAQRVIQGDLFSWVFVVIVDEYVYFQIVVELFQGCNESVFSSGFCFTTYARMWGSFCAETLKQKTCLFCNFQRTVPA